MQKRSNNSFRIKTHKQDCTLKFDYDRDKVLDAVAFQDHYSKFLKMPKLPMARKNFPEYQVRKIQVEKMMEAKQEGKSEYKNIGKKRNKTINTDKENVGL